MKVLIILVYYPKVIENKIVNDLNYLQKRAENEKIRGLNCYRDPYKSCKIVHVIAILTEWDEFKELDWQKIDEK